MKIIWKNEGLAYPYSLAEVKFELLWVIGLARQERNKSYDIVYTHKNYINFFDILTMPIKLLLVLLMNTTVFVGWGLFVVPFKLLSGVHIVIKEEEESEIS